MTAAPGQPATSPTPTAVEPAARFVTPTEQLALGVSPSVYALLSLLALLASRGVAPALPGSATGIASWITASAFFAACLSQLLAAGGVVLCIRLLGLVSALPSLGVAFRMAMLPAGLGVVALVAAAAARPLEPDLGRVLAIAAAVASATAAPQLLGSRWGKLPGILLLAMAVTGALDLVADELGARGGGTLRNVSAVAVAFLATATGVGAALTGLRWAARDRREFAVVVASTAAGVAVVLSAAALGEQHTAGMTLVLLHRSLEALSQRQFFAVPLLLAESATLFLLVASAAMLLAVRTRRADLRAAVALCLLGSVVPGAPASALLSVAGALLLVRAASDPHAPRERSLGTR